MRIEEQFSSMLPDFSIIFDMGRLESKPPCQGISLFSVPPAFSPALAKAILMTAQKTTPP
ncbi:hypothetical protein VDQ94_03850 [Xanthomonas campestris pv. campestris]|uniref:hypothetical protein n=1 Tax=Xanthomonas campestris TaxID=339 RepID=UPI002B3B9795|nr:hypothetical protein [Xanthomonas campestris pv. campestris]MEB1551227.1 hypothetical protein [Xanthomonas campestris pv. campestris]